MQGKTFHSFPFTDSPGKYLAWDALSDCWHQQIHPRKLLDGYYRSAYTRVKFSWCLPHVLKNLVLPVEKKKKKKVVEKETQMKPTFFPSNTSNPCFLMLQEIFSLPQNMLGSRAHTEGKEGRHCTEVSQKLLPCCTSPSTQHRSCVCANLAATWPPDPSGSE